MGRRGRSEHHQADGNERNPTATCKVSQEQCGQNHRVRVVLYYRFKKPRGLHGARPRELHDMKRQIRQWGFMSLIDD